MLYEPSRSVLARVRVRVAVGRLVRFVDDISERVGMTRFVTAPQVVQWFA